MAPAVRTALEICEEIADLEARRLELERELLELTLVTPADEAAQRLQEFREQFGGGL